MPECTCYPYGFTPATYEGPMRHCPVHGECICTPGDTDFSYIEGPNVHCPIHGEETDDFPGRHGDDIDNGMSLGDLEDLVSGFQEDFRKVIQAISGSIQEAPKLLVSPTLGRAYTNWYRGELLVRVIAEESAVVSDGCQIGPGKWIGPVVTPRWERVQGGLPNVANWPLNVTNRIANDLGGSKVGEESARLVPTDSAPGQEGCNQSLTRALEGAWKRTFGLKTRVGIPDLKNFPHLTGSHWFPLVPGTSAGQEEMSPLTGSRSYRGNQSGTHSPGASGSGVRQHQDRESVAPWAGRRRRV